MKEQHRFPSTSRQLTLLLITLFGICLTGVLFWVVAAKAKPKETPTATPITLLSTNEIVTQHAEKIDALLSQPRRPLQRHNAAGEEIYTPIKALPNSFSGTFSDNNQVQWETASRLGIPACATREDLEHYKAQLVKISETPLYYVRSLSYSEPYLVPRAARLLERIAQNFQDSLAMKGEDAHQLIVTSVLRTEADIAKLSQRNRNASSQSCHLFATTFDISYTKFLRPENEAGVRGEMGDPYALKMILGEVLRDLRDLGTCYVKYEIHQACFHITAR